MYSLIRIKLHTYYEAVLVMHLAWYEDRNFIMLSAQDRGKTITHGSSCRLLTKVVDAIPGVEFSKILKSKC